MSVFELEPIERLELLKVLTQQLISYSTFRETMDQRSNKLFETRKEIRQLKTWDAAQDNEARKAKLAREYEEEQLKNETDETKTVPERPKPGRNVLKLRAFIKTASEGRRVLNLDEIKNVGFGF